MLTHDYRRCLRESESVSANIDERWREPVYGGLPRRIDDLRLITDTDGIFAKTNGSAESWELTSR